MLKLKDDENGSLCYLKPVSSCRHKSKSDFYYYMIFGTKIKSRNIQEYSLKDNITIF